jgi:flagellar hook-length control protein FliK
LSTEVQNSGDVYSQFTNLLEQLEATEVEIRCEEPSEVTKSPLTAGEKGEQAIITFLAGQAGRQLALQTKLNKNKIKVEALNKSHLKHAELKNSVITEPGKQASVSFHTGKVQQVMGERLFQNMTPHKSKLDVPWGSNELNNSWQSSGENIDMPVMTSTAGGENHGRVSEKVTGDVRPFRLVLPADIKSALRPNGQAISLRIEPEHLGPARLKLVMRDNILTARVMVKHAHAKIAIENSINNLVEQLTKAGIDVANIEVALSGGDGGNSQNQFERKAFWQHRVSSSVWNRLGNELNDIPSVTPVAYSSAYTYLRADGVNLLA